MKWFCQQYWFLQSKFLSKNDTYIKKHNGTMRGVVIASAWITFAFLAIAIGLFIASSHYSMKEPATDATKMKARRFAMASFWLLVVALIFGLIAAITASCGPSLSKTLSEVASRMMRRGPALLPAA
jgi:lysylphosphatidylglycerol synthetase-like protein (DUF2156 family)